MNMSAPQNYQTGEMEAQSLKMNTIFFKEHLKLKDLLLLISSEGFSFLMRCF